MSEFAPSSTQEFKQVRPAESALREGEESTRVQYPDLAEEAAYESKDVRDLIAKAHAVGKYELPKYKEDIYNNAADQIEDVTINGQFGLDMFKKQEIVDKYVQDGTESRVAADRVNYDYQHSMDTSEAAGADYKAQVAAARADVDKALEIIRNR